MIWAATVWLATVAWLATWAPTLLYAAEPLTLLPTYQTHSSDAADLHPGVVVDESRGVAYLMNPDGGVDAVALDSGDLLWSSEQAARPLTVAGDRLIAQGPPTVSRGTLGLVVLDTTDGTRRQDLQLGLPANVRATVDGALGVEFEAWGSVVNGEPYVLWEETRRYTKGIAPEPGEPMEEKLEGAGRLDLAAGNAIAVDPADVERQPPLPSAAEQAARQWRAAGELASVPRLAGDTLAAVRTVGQRILLARWSPQGAPLPEVELFSGPFLHQIRSADGRHLAVVERVAPGEWEEYGWTLFSLETGRRLGQVRQYPSHAWYIVHGTQLIHVAPPYGRRVGDERIVEERRLRSIDINSGEPLWEQPLRDTEYRGPFPP
jgi:hypothetical protein